MAGLGPTVELKEDVERAFATVTYPEVTGTDHLQLALERPGVVPKPHRLKRLVDAELGRPEEPK